MQKQTFHVNSSNEQNANFEMPSCVFVMYFKRCAKNNKPFSVWIPLVLFYFRFFRFEISKIGKKQNFIFNILSSKSNQFDFICSHRNDSNIKFSMKSGELSKRERHFLESQLCIATRAHCHIAGKRFLLMN